MEGETHLEGERLAALLHSVPSLSLLTPAPPPPSSLTHT